MDIHTTDLEIQVADTISPCSAHVHPENKLTTDVLSVARSVVNLIKTQERVLNDFLLRESNGSHTEFRIVVREDGTYYCHVLGKDSKTIDGKLLQETKKHWSYYYQKWIE